MAHIELDHLGQYDRDLFALSVSKCEDDANEHIKFLLESLDDMANAYIKSLNDISKNNI